MRRPKKQPYLMRRNALRRHLEENKIDAYVIFDQSDLFYLTAFPSEGCFALVSAQGDVLFAPALLAGQARDLTANDKIEVRAEAGLLKSLGQLLLKSKVKRIGYDPSKVTVELFHQLQSLMKSEWIELPGFILKQRMIKDALEIQSIERACRITATASKICFKNLRAGLSEKELAYNLESFFHRLGSPKIAFETIVAFNEHASFPHHVVTDKKLMNNSTVLTDLGCRIDGYCSDLTRTTFFGKISSKFAKIYDIVRRSQAAGMAAIRDGVTAGEIDYICRSLIKDEGYEDFFTHGTGHGVGIDIHEPPRLGINSKEVLKAGMIVTVEPGIYLPGEFGVRIEDTLLVTKNGSRILTVANEKEGL